MEEHTCALILASKNDVLHLELGAQRLTQQIISVFIRVDAKQIAASISVPSLTAHGSVRNSSRTEDQLPDYRGINLQIAPFERL
jgi:hypothetical protein